MTLWLDYLDGRHDAYFVDQEPTITDDGVALRFTPTDAVIAHSRLEKYGEPIFVPIAALRMWSFQSEETA